MAFESLRSHQCVDDTDRDAGTSPGIGADDLAGIFAGKRVDLLKMRRVLPDAWSAFLRAHFRDRIEVAYFFSVDERTARNWWDGVGSPRAEVVLVTVASYPAALPFLMRAAA